MYLRLKSANAPRLIGILIASLTFLVSVVGISPHAHAQDFEPPSGNPPPHPSDTSKHHELDEDYAPYLGQRYKRTILNIESLYTTFMRMRYTRGEAYMLASAFVGNVFRFLGTRPENNTEGNNFNAYALTFLTRALSLNSRDFFPRLTEHPWLSTITSNARDIAIAFLVIGFCLLGMHWISALGLSSPMRHAESLRNLISIVIISFIVLNGPQLFNLVQDIAHEITKQLCDSTGAHVLACSPGARIHHALFDLDPESPVPIRIANSYIAFSLTLLIAAFRLAQEIAIVIILVFAIPAIAALAIPFFGENITRAWLKMYIQYIVAAILLFGLYFITSVLLSRLIEAAPRFASWRDLLKFFYWIIAAGFAFGYSYVTYDVLLRPVIKEVIGFAPVVISSVGASISSAVNALSSPSLSAPSYSASSPSRRQTVSNQASSVLSLIQDETSETVQVVAIPPKGAYSFSETSTAANPSLPLSTDAPTDSPFSIYQTSSPYYLFNALATQPPALALWLSAWVSTIDAVGGSISNISRTTNEPFAASLMHTLYIIKRHSAQQTIAPSHGRPTISKSPSESPLIAQGVSMPLPIQGDTMMLVGNYLPNGFIGGALGGNTGQPLMDTLKHFALPQNSTLTGRFMEWSTPVLLHTSHLARWNVGIDLAIKEAANTDGDLQELGVIQVGKWQTMAGSVIAHKLLHSMSDVSKEEFVQLEQASVVSAALIKKNFSAQSLQHVLSRNPDKFWNAGANLTLGLLSANGGGKHVPSNAFGSAAIGHLLLSNTLDHHNDDQGSPHQVSLDFSCFIDDLADNKPNNSLSKLLKEHHRNYGEQLSDMQEKIAAALITESFSLPHSAYYKVLDKVKRNLNRDDAEWLSHEITSKKKPEDITAAIRLRYHPLIQEFLPAYVARNDLTFIANADNRDADEPDHEKDAIVGILTSVVIGERRRKDDNMPKPVAAIQRKCRFAQRVGQQGLTT